MDINTTQLMQQFQESWFPSFAYDVLKFVVAFIIVNILYEKVFLKYKWGNWHVKIYNNLEKDAKPIVDRVLSISVAKKIIDDKGEFSIYVKGIISPYAWLNIDIASQDAEDMRLIKIDKSQKTIVVDLSKNPPKKQ